MDAEFLSVNYPICLVDGKNNSARFGSDLSNFTVHFLSETFPAPRCMGRWGREWIFNGFGGPNTGGSGESFFFNGNLAITSRMQFPSTVLVIYILEH